MKLTAIVRRLTYVLFVTTGGSRKANTKIKVLDDVRIINLIPFGLGCCKHSFATIGFAFGAGSFPDVAPVGSLQPFSLAFGSQAGGRCLMIGVP